MTGDEGRARRLILQALSLVTYLVIVSGCATLTHKVEPPTVSLAGIQLLELGLLEQRYRLQLRIQNPNDFALPIAGMEYRVNLNDAEFAHGVSSHSVSVPAFDEAVLEVDGVSNLSSVLNQLQLLGSRREQTLRYALTGSAKLKNRLLRIPFEYHDEINLALEQ